MIQVLDKGYVRLVDSMGNDLSVVNAARTSFLKESKEFTPKDEKLIQYLAREGHSAPFRHVILSFEVKAPIFVARQWWKYVVGSVHDDGDGAEGYESTWSEASRRYITLEPEFYIPDEWRSAPENKKQGSGDPLDYITSETLSDDLILYINRGMLRYEAAIKSGACVEQARFFLPAYAMYTIWRWTASLQAVAHFLTQRLAHGAQKEIQSYADAVLQLSMPVAPISLSALMR